MAASLERVTEIVGRGRVLACVTTPELHSLFWASSLWCQEALSTRAHRVWRALRASWRPFSFLFRPGATEEELTALERRVGPVPRSIKAIMQECQGASLPCFQQAFGDAVMDLWPVSNWYVLRPETHLRVRHKFPAGSREAPRLIVGGDWDNHTMLRMDDWRLESLHIGADGEAAVYFAGMKGERLADWIARNNSSVCCAGAYIEHLKSTAKFCYGCVQERFPNATAMLRGLLDDFGPRDLMHPEDWEASFGPSWRAAVLDGFARRPFPWFQHYEDSPVAVAIWASLRGTDEMRAQLDSVDQQQRDAAYLDLRRRVEEAQKRLRRQLDAFHDRNSGCLLECLRWRRGKKRKALEIAA